MRLRFTPLASAAVLSVVLAATPALAQLELSGERMLENGAPMSFSPLIEKVAPAVVSLNVEANVQIDNDLERFGLDPEDLPFFFPNPDQGQRQRASSGSGFFVSSDGFIVTNHHVVDDASEITVTLHDGSTLQADVVGTDPSSDLAVIRVNREEPFSFVEFADPENVKVGDWVVAIGNPFSLGVSASAGIVSAINRDLLDGRGGGRYTPYIQIDAPINPGNSGGPSFDLYGRVVGVNTQIISRSGGSNGVGFAISSDVARDVVGALIADGEVQRGWLGVFLQTVNDDFAMGLGLDEARGAIVSQVVDDSPADSAGFRNGDIILAIEGQEVENSIEATRLVGGLKAGERAQFQILRDGRERTLRVTIGNRDDADAAAAGDPRPTERNEAAGAAGLVVKEAEPRELERVGLDERDEAVIVERVLRGSAADRQGVRRGTAVVEVGGDPVGSVDAFYDAIATYIDEGREVAIITIVDRNGRRFVPLRLNPED